MIYICKPKKVSIYINTQRKSTSQIKAETGCTALINGGLYDMKEFRPVCHLKANGKVLAKDQYKYLGFGWNENELHLVTDYKEYKNYIACVCLVRDGKPVNLIYNADLGGYRPRTALGVFDDGRVWLYAVTSPARTPENLQKFALQSGLKDCIMLDGGGSTQGASPNESINSARKVHNYICVWEEEQKGEEKSMFKIALGAGHGINTAGKRCMKEIDPNETREWWLNDRICDKVELMLRDYDGYELLRLDDSDGGEDDVSLSARTTAANKWGADFYLSVHHNAGINGGTGGGIVAFVHPNASKTSFEWRDELYDALIKKTGLKGNRTYPLATANFHVLRETAMPAVLVELGFMDSRTDVPIILTDDYAAKCAEAIVETIVKRCGLKKKAESATEMYKVQVGAFKIKANAERLKDELNKKGYPAHIVKYYE